MTASPERKTSFGPTLRSWRELRRLSQLELSFRADISQRHLSWLETGRSSPSRRMVLQLAEALDVPLRDRNRLLNAAGFADVYRRRGLEERQMGAVRDALCKMLDQAMPYPSLVVDREWNVVQTNPCADALLATVDAVTGPWNAAAGDERNLAVLSLHPEGLRPLIENWDEVAPSFVQRLRRDLERTTDPELQARLESLVELAGEHAAVVPMPNVDLLPILTLDLRLGEHRLRLFSVISTFGTPQDVTADELRIESFFPLDDSSDALLRTLAEGRA